jgi:hypothetical protein
MLMAQTNHCGPIFFFEAEIDRHPEQELGRALGLMLLDLSPIEFGSVRSFNEHQQGVIMKLIE